MLSCPDKKCASLRLKLLPINLLEYIFIFGSFFESASNKISVVAFELKFHPQAQEYTELGSRTGFLKLKGHLTRVLIY